MRSRVEQQEPRPAAPRDHSFDPLAIKPARGLDIPNGADGSDVSVDAAVHAMRNARCYTRES